MSHLPSIIVDLAIILICASVFGLICRILKQPIVLGYIVAGFIAGTHFNLFPTVEPQNIKTWADIGVIFLLFGMGLDFSFKKLIKIRKIGGRAMIFEAIALAIVGFLIGRIIGWTTADSLLLGAMLIMSSTAIILKTLSDLGQKNDKYANIVFGILIFEDFFAILIIVILSTLAITKEFESQTLAWIIAKLIFFIVIWFVAGIYIIPTVLKKIKRWLNSEILLIISIGLCFGMVVFATKVGFSAALGAFVMGSLLAETIELERIESITLPLKDFFAAIFFVSVGMMVDPIIIRDNFKIIILISIASILGKIIFTTIGVRLTGQSLKTSIQSGFSLAQMGEFAFIVAGTGMTLHLTSSFIYPIIIGVSVITIFTTPYTIKLALPAYNVIESTLPKKWLDKINLNEDRRSAKPTSGWGELLKSYSLYLILFVFICIAIVIVSSKYLLPFANQILSQNLSNIFVALITLLALAPFLRGMIHNRGNQPFLFLSIWSEEKNNRIFLTLLIAIRYLIAYLFVVIVLQKHFAIPSFVIFLIAALLFGFIFQSKILLKNYWRIESRFVKNFNQRQIEQRRKENAKGEENGEKLHELDNLHWIDKHLYIATFILIDGKECHDKTLKELDFRSKFNILILSILRNQKQVNFPDGDFKLLKDDIILVSGGINDLQNVTQFYSSLTLNFKDTKTLNEFAIDQQENPNSTIKSMTFIVDKTSAWIGKNLMDSKVGKRSKCLVIGVEREGLPILNPSSHFVFRTNDMIWVMGEEKALYKLLENNFFE